MSTRRAAAIWFLLALVVGVLFARAALPGIAPASDLWDYAQEARQLARGEGFTSLYTYPVFLGQEEPPFPVRWRMPLYAVLGALLLRLGITLPAGFLHLGALTHAFLVALIFLLGARLGSPRSGAWAAAGALACPLLLDFYNPGMSQTLAALLGVIVWLLLLGSSRRVVVGAVAGAAAAAAWYLRGESLLFVPIWLWVATRGGRRPLALTFAITYAAICLPWFLASRAGGGTIQGNPMLLYTADYPGYSSSRMLNAALPGILEYVRTHPGAFALRFAKDVAGYLIDLAGGIGVVMLAVASIGIVRAGRRAVRDLLRRHAPLLAAIALQILALSALERSPRFLVPIVPLVLALLGIFALPVLEKIEKRAILPGLMLLAMLDGGCRLLYQRGDALRRFPPVPAATAPALLDRSRTWSRDALVLSDAPDWIAWHLDRPALLLPLSAQVDSLVAARPVAAIWLSPGARWRNQADGETTWVRVQDRGERLPWFRGPETLPGGTRLYVIGSSRPAEFGSSP